MSELPARPTLVCGGVSFERTPVEVRERVAVSPARLAEALGALKQRLQLDEVVLLSTCNRVEYFGMARDVARTRAAWPEFLREFHAVPEDLGGYVFHHEEANAVDHLFQVASGLKSMVVGETEILGQVKDAYETARQTGVTGRWLNRLFQMSFAAAKAVRSGTSITRGSVSVGSVAVELAERIFGKLQSCTVMVIGAGEVSERTARSLQSRGVEWLMVANRTFAHAQELAGQLGGRAVTWEDWEREAVAADIVISSTRAPHFILDAQKLAPILHQRSGRPLFLIDLAVPRDFDPAIHMMDDVFLYNIDDLQGIANRNLEDRAAEVARCVEILEPHIKKYGDWVRHQPGGAHPAWWSRQELSSA